MPSERDVRGRQKWPGSGAATEAPPWKYPFTGRRAVEVGQAD